MKEYRYSLAITSQFYFCGIPFRLDTSPKCSLNCAYCFAMARGGRRTLSNQIANPKRIYEKFLRSERYGDESLDIVGVFLKNKAPVHFGGMSDPLADRTTNSVSKTLLKMLAEFQYPVVISTKNTDELMQDETLVLLKNIHDLAIQVSVSSIDQYSTILEPHVPDTMKRINALRELNQEGLYTIVRLQPILPKSIHEISDEMIPLLAQAGVKHVIVEFLKIPLETKLMNFSKLFRAIEWDGFKYYKDVKAIRTGREWVLPVQYKWDLLQPIVEAIHENGMTYGAGDYGLNHLSDTDCCCGIDKVPGFQNFFKGNIPYLIKNSKSNELTFTELGKNSDANKSIRMYMNSQCRTDNASTIYDFMKSKWNRPSSENAPNTFLGVTWNNEYDDEGNCLYRKIDLN